MKKIIVDMFGADAPPEVIVRGAAKALTEQTEYDLVLVGNPLIAQIVLQEEAARLGVPAASLLERVFVIATDAFVTNRENPRRMVKELNDTSMVLGMKALKADDEVKAFVTAGSTGCALVGSCFHVGLEKGLLQPALTSALPKEGGGMVLLLDCGAALTPLPKDLAAYARLGSAFAHRSLGVAIPKVGLLNVGSEKNKGTQLLQEAYTLIEENAAPNNYCFIGNIEGGDILSGKADVVVCDGLTGNVILKGLEHAGLLAAKICRESEGAQTNAAGSTNLPASEKIRLFFDYNSQAGAIFLGTKKLIIKAHGAATEETVCACILQAIRLSEQASR